MPRIKNTSEDFDLSKSLAGLSIDRERSIGPQMYVQLRNRIINNQLPAGARIHENELAEICAVSRTPLRAALQRLANEGLILTRPQVGSVVAPRDEIRTREALFIRSAIEQQVAARLAETGFDEGALQPILTRQEAAADIDDYASFFVADEEFHALLAASAGVPNAWQLVQSVKAHVDRERLNLMSSIPGRSRRAFDEHMRLLKAIRARDPDAARKIMREHIESVLEALGREEASPPGGGAPGESTRAVG